MEQRVTADVVSLASGFRDSDAFDKLLKDNISLVEKVGDYLHGAGQKDVQSLDETAMAVYERAGSNMTLRLMETTAWLLSQRSIKEGKPRWNRDRHVVPSIVEISDAELETLPPKMRALVSRTDEIARRVRHLMILNGRPQARVFRK